MLIIETPIKMILTFAAGLADQLQRGLRYHNPLELHDLNVLQYVPHFIDT